MEVIEAVERALGRPVPRSVGGRRAGDPPGLVADPARARSLLGWSPARSSLDQIVGDAARWHANQRYGRAAHAEARAAPKQQPQAAEVEGGGRLSAQSAV
jgi:hypothetical protein